MLSKELGDSRDFVWALEIFVGWVYHTLPYTACVLTSKYFTLLFYSLFVFYDPQFIYVEEEHEFLKDEI